MIVYTAQKILLFLSVFAVAPHAGSVDRNPAVSDMDTPWNGYRYTTYETRIALPAGALETAPDIWAEAVKQADRTQAAAQARAERDRLISACDWTVLDDAKTDKQAWATYRQALRDVPEQPGFPYDVSWPAIPGQL